MGKLLYNLRLRRIEVKIPVVSQGLDCSFCCFRDKFCRRACISIVWLVSSMKSAKTCLKLTGVASRIFRFVDVSFDSTCWQNSSAINLVLSRRYLSASRDCFGLYCAWAKSDMGKLRPAGQVRPAGSFYSGPPSLTQT